MPQKKKISKALTKQQTEDVQYWEKLIKEGKAVDKIKKIVHRFKSDIDPDHVYRKLAKLMPKSAKDEELDSEENKIVDQAFVCSGFENNYSMIEAVEERYRGLIINFKRQLIQEYNCQSYSEKALVDIVVNSYARVFTYSKKFLCLKDSQYLSNERNGFLSVLSKETDRANRHFLTALETLKQFKQPEMKINVKTKNAFIAQNQQINANQDKPNETIETK